MASWIRLRCMAKIPRVSLASLHGSRFYSTKSSKPLRILFCGSDGFSSASLRALHAEHERDPQFIKSIDVLCRPGKPSGRSLKNIREVPIKAVAQELSLPVHERDTFTGWDLPRPQGEAINLIIAVSFGLFVPPRILKSAEYGGLNVHPSILPGFRGPAPLQHTILSGAKKTGITLQTLDDKSFDHGIILAQTPDPFLSIPNWEHCTYDELLAFVSPKAASMLIQGLRDRVFVPPLVKAGLSTTKNCEAFPRSYKSKHATKITPEERKIFSLEWDGSRIYRQYRAVGRVWSDVWIDAKTTKRLIFEDITVVDRSAVISDWIEQWKNKSHKTDTEEKEEEIDSAAIRFFVPSKDKGPRQPLLYIEDGDAVVFNAPHSCLRIGSITVEGRGKKPASKALRSIHREGVWRLMSAAPKYALGNTCRLLVEPVEAGGIEEEQSPGPRKER